MIYPVIYDSFGCCTHGYDYDKIQNIINHLFYHISKNYYKEMLRKDIKKIVTHDNDAV